jgi:Bacterial regulatory proteins, gntR family/Periplasmic binding protein-like domain
MTSLDNRTEEDSGEILESAPTAVLPLAAGTALTRSGRPKKRPGRRKGQVTARRQLVDELSQDILAGRYEADRLMPSEHQLCRKFDVSRVTVRLALGELESRGLIYRHHGKGTFAHPLGRLDRKPLGLLLGHERWSDAGLLRDFIAGMRVALDVERTDLQILHRSPLEWSPAVGSMLGGVVVVAEDFPKEERDALRKRGVPYLALGETDPEIARIDLGLEAAFREALPRLMAKPGDWRLAVVRAGSSRNPFDSMLQAALESAHAAIGKGAVLREVRCTNDHPSARHAIKLLLREAGRQPIALVCFGEAMAVDTYAAAQELGLSIPERVRVLVCGGCESADFMEPPLAQIEVPAFQAGWEAAASLGRCSLAGGRPDDVTLPTSITWRTSAGDCP